jgi:hypothetical protein
VGIKIHPRTVVVRNAEQEISAAVDAIQKKHDLTSLEFIQILTGMIALELKFCLRSERHPEEPEKGGDEA